MKPTSVSLAAALALSIALKVAAFAEAQHHVEKREVLLAVRDRIMLAPDGADANTAEGEDAGLDRCLANQFNYRADVDVAIEIA